MYNHNVHVCGRFHVCFLNVYTCIIIHKYNWLGFIIHGITCACMWPYAFTVQVYMYIYKMYICFILSLFFWNIFASNISNSKPKISEFECFSFIYKMYMYHYCMYMYMWWYMYCINAIPVLNLLYVYMWWYMYMYICNTKLIKYMYPVTLENVNIWWIHDLDKDMYPVTFENVNVLWIHDLDKCIIHVTLKKAIVW